jgi:hypothetical protein
MSNLVASTFPDQVGSRIPNNATADCRFGFFLEMPMSLGMSTRQVRPLLLVTLAVAAALLASSLVSRSGSSTGGGGGGVEYTASGGGEGEYTPLGRHVGNAYYGPATRQFWEGTAESETERCCGPANGPLPRLQWEATGVVVWEPPVRGSTSPPGTVLYRPWSFHSDCRRKCRIVFFRYTLSGPSETTLVKRGHAYLAKFPPVRVPCSYVTGSSWPPHKYLYGAQHDSYTLWWSADRSQIYARERQTESGCYPTTRPPSYTRWHAVRTSDLRTQSVN